MKKRVLFEQKKIKFCNKRRVVESKTGYAACLKKFSKFHCILNILSTFVGVIFCMCSLLAPQVFKMLISVLTA